jgi:hypothetical protein
MTTVSDNCHNLNSDLKKAVSLVKKDICYDLIKVLGAVVVVVCLVKYSDKIHITFNPILTTDNLVLILSFILDLKIINDLRDSSKKLLTLKILKDEVEKLYPKADPNTCENQTCIMMKRVMEGTLS